MDTLTDELERSFGDGPAHPPLDALVASGHRALRRRRLATAAAGLAAVAVLGTTYAAASGGQGRAVDPAGSPGPSPGATTADPTPTSTGNEDVDGGLTVGYDSRGALVYGQGVQLVRHLDNPLHRTAPARSDAVEVVRDGRRAYWLLEWRGNGDYGSSASDPADKNMGSLEDWVAYTAEAMGEASGGDGTAGGSLHLGDLVSLRPDGTLAPGPRTTILEQRAGIDVGASFAGPRATTAAALVRRDGARWWVLVRQVGAQDPEYFPVSYRVGGRTMAAFLDHSRQQYAGGEGLR